MGGRLRVRAGVGQQLTPNRGHCRSVVQLDAHPTFCHSLRKLQEPGLLRFGALTAN
jgi:hypothetical protein